jgi:hypothetical protein
MPSILDDYVSPSDLARELGVNPVTLARWHAARIGPPRMKMGRRVLYRGSSVAAWLETQEQQLVASPGDRARRFGVVR